MFSITGIVSNVFRQPGGKDKSGNQYPDTTKIQLQGEVILKNGEKKFDLVTLTLPENSELEKQSRDKIGKSLTLPIGIYASGGQIRPFLT